MIEIQEEFYHGWMIRVSRQQIGYTFLCWIADQDIGITDARSYSTASQALRAGQLRADLESVRLSLTTFLYSKLQCVHLTSDEREALEYSLFRYIDTAQHWLS